MRLRQAPRLSYSLFVLFSIGAVFILLFRVPFGIDVTDEAFHTAESYLIAQGAVPFVDNWSPTCLAFLLPAPFVWLFTVTTGGTEGLMSFMFYISFLFRLIVPVLIWFLLRKRMGPSWAAIICLLFFICDYGNNRTLNYNFMSRALLALGGSLLWNALGQEKTRDAVIRYALAGLVMALCALTHITQIVNCLLFAVFLLVLERRRCGKLLCWLPYVLTGLTAAVLTIAGLEAAGGGGLFAGIFLNLEQNNYFRIPLTPLTTHLLTIIVDCVEIFPLVCLPFAGIMAIYLTIFYYRSGQAIRSGLTAALSGSCWLFFLFYGITFLNGFQNGFILRSQPLFCLYLLACFLFAGTLVLYLMVLYRRSRQTILPGLMAALVGGCGVCCFFYAIAYFQIFQNGEHYIDRGQLFILCLFLTTPVWFFLLPQQDRQQFLPGFLFFWTAGFVSIVAAVLTAYEPVNFRYGHLTSGALFSLPLAAAAFKVRAPRGLFPSGVCKILLLFLAGSLATSSLSLEYANVYRDEPISALTCRVERGACKGLYTTPERADALLNLEDQLRARVSPRETVFCKDWIPIAYLMTDALPCTPTTCDPCFYGYGFQDDDIYQSYLEKTGGFPDKIIYIQSDATLLSIDDPKNALADWVYANYTLAETVGEGLFSFRIFTRNS